jgi:hypothetical protein
MVPKYFLGDERAKKKLSQWIKKETETRYYIGRPLEMCDDVFESLRTILPTTHDDLRYLNGYYLNGRLLNGYYIPNTKYPISNDKDDKKLLRRFNAELSIFGL